MPNSEGNRVFEDQHGQLILTPSYVGSSGSVFRGFLRQQPVAIKVCPAQDLAPIATKARCKGANMGACHPHLIHQYPSVSDMLLKRVMHPMPLCSFSLAEVHLADLTIPEKYAMLGGVLSGLVHLHTQHGVAHGNVKPSNILFSEQRLQSIRWVAMLSDWNNSCGLRIWLSPELTNKRSVSSQQADMYAFGQLVLYTMSNSKHPSLSERCPPLDSEPLRGAMQLLQNISPALKDLVTELVQPAHMHRPTSRDTLIRFYSIAAPMLGIDRLQDIRTWLTALKLSKRTASKHILAFEDLDIGWGAQSHAPWVDLFADTAIATCIRDQKPNNSKFGMLEAVCDSYLMVNPSVLTQFAAVLPRLLPHMHAFFDDHLDSIADTQGENLFCVDVM